jgi:AAA domain
VELVVAEVLQARSVDLTRTDDGISEPAALRRTDGSSVYTVAGSELFTSAQILAAEQRLVVAAGRTDGRVVEAATVDLALLEAAANGNALDAGQAALVRAMCTSGSRLQLAIAPAGAGKTIAMRALARGWSDSGPGARASPVGGCGGAAPRRHRYISRNAGEAHLVHPPR